MWKMPRLVAARFAGAFEPGNRFIVALLLDQVRTDVVIRIAKVRIDFDGALALDDGLVNAALKVVSPPEERVGLGGGVHLERRSIKLDGAIVIAFHLCLV